MKKILEVSLIVFGIIILMVAICIGVFRYKTEYAKTELETSQSEDGIHKLIIYQIGEPDSPFGPGKCRLVLLAGSENICTADIVMLNDGKWPHPENFDVQWRDNSVKIIANGEEMEDVTRIMYFDGRVE